MRTWNSYQLIIVRITYSLSYFCDTYKCARLFDVFAEPILSITSRTRFELSTPIRLWILTIWVLNEFMSSVEEFKIAVWPLAPTISCSPDFVWYTPCRWRESKAWPGSCPIDSFPHNIMWCNSSCSKVNLIMASIPLFYDNNLPTISILSIISGDLHISSSNFMLARVQMAMLLPFLPIQ